MITFSTEDWNLIKHEVMPLWEKHYYHIADPEDEKRIPLDPDWDRYQNAFDRGSLHITGARQDGELIGYAFVFVETGLHYKSTLFGHWDIYWVEPQHRGHMVGIKLFQEVERCMKARGVVKMTSARKLWYDTGSLFRRLGWKDTETKSTKWIGPE